MLYVKFIDSQPPTIPESKARRSRGDGSRDLLASKRQRTSAQRNVEQASLIIGKPLDYPKPKWPKVIRTLARFGADDWRKLRADPTYLDTLIGRDGD